MLGAWSRTGRLAGVAGGIYLEVFAVLALCFQILAWMQPEATGGSAPAGGGGGGGSTTSGCAMQGGMLAAMLGLMFLFIIRPQQKQQKEREAMLKSVRRGSIVRTTGGIRGEIVELDDRDVTLMIADRVKINVLRSHISGIESASSEATSAKPVEKSV